ncbi:MAG TPA: c-type cytochrome [Candidatus Acidoferrales bacterium]|nr:c-type cytochrome [Candidatus Acidoferrales bacterium]
MNRFIGAASLATFGLLGAAVAGGICAPQISYTAAQAWHGRLLYYEHCAECHGGDLGGMYGPALAGPNGELQWETGQYVYSYITAAMPHGDPGALPAMDYVDLMAFLYQQHGKPAGTKPLDAKAIEADAAKMGG